MEDYKRATPKESDRFAEEFCARFGYGVDDFVDDEAKYIGAAKPQPLIQMDLGVKRHKTKAEQKGFSNGTSNPKPIQRRKSTPVKKVHSVGDPAKSDTDYLETADTLLRLRELNGAQIDRVGLPKPSNGPIDLSNRDSGHSVLDSPGVSDVSSRLRYANFPIKPNHRFIDDSPLSSREYLGKNGSRPAQPKVVVESIRHDLIGTDNYLSHQANNGFHHFAYNFHRPPCRDVNRCESQRSHLAKVADSHPIPVNNGHPLFDEAILDEEAEGLLSTIYGTVHAEPENVGEVPTSAHNSTSAVVETVGVQPSRAVEPSPTDLIFSVPITFPPPNQLEDDSGVPNLIIDGVVPIPEFTETIIDLTDDVDDLPLNNVDAPEKQLSPASRCSEKDPDHKTMPPQNATIEKANVPEGLTTEHSLEVMSRDQDSLDGNTVEVETSSEDAQVPSSQPVISFSDNSTFQPNSSEDARVPPNPPEEISNSRTPQMNQADGQPEVEASMPDLTIDCVVPSTKFTEKIIDLTVNDEFESAEPSAPVLSPPHTDLIPVPAERTDPLIDISSENDKASTIPEAEQISSVMDVGPEPDEAPTIPPDEQTSLTANISSESEEALSNPVAEDGCFSVDLSSQHAEPPASPAAEDGCFPVELSSEHGEPPTNPETEETGGTLNPVEASKISSPDRRCSESRETPSIPLATDVSSEPEEDPENINFVATVSSDVEDASTNSVAEPTSVPVDATLEPTEAPTNFAAEQLDPEETATVNSSPPISNPSPIPNSCPSLDEQVQEITSQGAHSCSDIEPEENSPESTSLDSHHEHASPHLETTVSSDVEDAPTNSVTEPSSVPTSLDSHFKHASPHLETTEVQPRTPLVYDHEDTEPLPSLPHEPTTPIPVVAVESRPDQTTSPFADSQRHDPSSAPPTPRPSDEDCPLQEADVATSPTPFPESKEDSTPVLARNSGCSRETSSATASMSTPQKNVSSPPRGKTADDVTEQSNDTPETANSTGEDAALSCRSSLSASLSIPYDAAVLAKLSGTPSFVFLDEDDEIRDPRMQNSSAPCLKTIGKSDPSQTQQQGSPDPAQTSFPPSVPVVDRQSLNADSSAYDFKDDSDALSESELSWRKTRFSKPLVTYGPSSKPRKRVASFTSFVHHYKSSSDDYSEAEPAPDKNIVTRSRNPVSKEDSLVLAQASSVFKSNFLSIISNNKEPVRRGRGRPKGSKNKAKNTIISSQSKTTPSQIKRKHDDVILCKELRVNLGRRVTVPWLAKTERGMKKPEGIDSDRSTHNFNTDDEASSDEEYRVPRRLHGRSNSTRSATLWPSLERRQDVFARLLPPSPPPTWSRREVPSLFAACIRYEMGLTPSLSWTAARDVVRPSERDDDFRGFDEETVKNSFESLCPCPECIPTWPSSSSQKPAKRPRRGR